MTTTETETGTKLVDLEVMRTVYGAASDRLEKVREAEAAEDGIARTDLTDVARNALLNWAARPTGGARRPQLVTIQPARRHLVPKDMDAGVPVFVATCRAPDCTFAEYGYSRAECRSKARGHGATHTRTFRFTMHRETYDAIKNDIQGRGLSVASVIQDGLDNFARTGQY